MSHYVVQLSVGFLSLTGETKYARSQQKSSASPEERQSTKYSTRLDTAFQTIDLLDLITFLHRTPLQIMQGLFYQESNALNGSASTNHKAKRSTSSSDLWKFPEVGKMFDVAFCLNRLREWQQQRQIQCAKLSSKQYLK